MSSYSAYYCYIFKIMAFLFYVILGCLLLKTSDGEAAPPVIFIFGDSLVDAGNNNYIATLSRANYAPNGIDFPNQEPTGRFTNGRTIVDILGQSLGLEQFAPPYLAPSTTGDAVLKGVNYASGAGGILNKTGCIFGGRLNMDAQIDHFANTRQDMISLVGPTAASSLLTAALYSIAVGSNDFINNYLLPLLSVPERAVVPPEVFVEAVIARFKRQLTRLYGLGARRILVSNVGPIGCIPYMRDVSPSATDGDCVELPNRLAQAYNYQLKDLVVELNSKLEGVMIVYADVYRIFIDIIENHTSYGFEVVDSACCFLEGKHGGLIPCGPPSRVCGDRSKYVFWDPYHPSDAANAVAARRLLDGDLDDIFPINVRQLANA